MTGLTMTISHLLYLERKAAGRIPDYYLPLSRNGTRPQFHYDQSTKL